MLRNIFTVLAIWCFVGQAVAASLPKSLVGVWATDISVLNGQLLFEGEALYLGADGVGAIVGGPPAIGIKVVASFEPTTGTISFDILEHEKVVGHGAAVWFCRNSVMRPSLAARQTLIRKPASRAGLLQTKLGL